MAFKFLRLLSLIILVSISPIAHSIRDPSSAEKTLRHHFIKDLQGCHKGDSRQGVNKLKRYLQKLGYLNYSNQNNDFDNSLESALKTYQENYHITPSGVVDAATVAKMDLPQCGVADIINGVNTMKNKSHHSTASKPKSIHTTIHYTFFPGSPRWSKSKLKYKFDDTTLSRAKTPIYNAFRKWAKATRYFTFSKETKRNKAADINIGFYRGDHGDGDPFDGPGGVIVAHAFPPPIGDLHFDADDTWGVAPKPGVVHLESIALHEIGHLLGLGHSTVPAAIMYPTLAHGETKLDFHQDDLDGIRALYNLPN